MVIAIKIFKISLMSRIRDSGQIQFSKLRKKFSLARHGIATLVAHAKFIGHLSFYLLLVL